MQAGVSRRLFPEEAVQQLLPGGLDVAFPAGRWVRQRFDPSHIEDVRSAIGQEFQRPGIGDTIRPGARIAVAVGSRGISRLAEIVAAVVTEVQRRGARPFIVPAMGSHGGATAEGQRQVLADYGVSEKTLGIEVRASMEVIKLGELADGTPVYFDRTASESDGIIVLNRVRPHAGFAGPTGSGLIKMIAIGLGKHLGATALHARGMATFASTLPEAARLALARMPILFGVAIVQNAYGQIALLEAVPAHRILEREPELLKIARDRMGRLLVEQIDLLIVDEIGKNISGDGMDGYVTGRLSDPTVRLAPKPQKIVVLGLTPETHGNATGIGLADVTTQQVLDSIDFVATYTNVATSTDLGSARIPVVMPTPGHAVALAFRTLNGVTPERAKVVRIKNTRELERIWVSEALWEEVSDRPEFEPLSEPAPLEI